MKAKQIQFLMVLAVALSLGGCQNEDVVISSDQEGNAKKLVQIRAGFSAPVQTRLKYEPDGAEPYPGLKVKWSVGDKFRLYAVDADNNMIVYKDYSIMSRSDLGPDGTTATFTGEAFEEDIIKQAKTYKAIYPAINTSMETVGLINSYERYFAWQNFINDPNYLLDGMHILHAETTEANAEGIDNLSFTAGLDVDNWWDVLRFDITLPEGEIPTKAVLYNGAMSNKTHEVTIYGGTNQMSVYVAVGNYKVKAGAYTSVTFFSDAGKAYTYKPNVTATKNYENNRVYSKVINFRNALPEIMVSDILDDNTVASTGRLSGSGSPDDPYLIQNAADLKNFVNSSRTYDSFQTVKLGTNIYVNASTWNACTLVKVNFDGGSHTISGQLIQDTSEENVFGFFGALFEGSISNLNIAASVTASSRRVGAICGYVIGYGSPNSSIKNCTNFGDLSNNPKSDQVHNTGGIVGLIEQVNLLENCKNYGNIICYTPQDDGCVGGVCGYIDDVAVTQLENYGEIDCRGSNAVSNVGGIAGRLTIDMGDPTSLTSCHNYNANFFTNQFDFVGSLIGWVHQELGANFTIDPSNTGVTNSDGTLQLIGYTYTWE